MISMISATPQSVMFWVFMIGIAYALLLYRFPNSWLTVILALLPILDFAPWTGQFFFDEYDVLLCLTIVTVLLQRRSQFWTRMQTGWSLTSLLLVSGLGFSVLVSALLGAYPFPAIDVNSFNNYLSPYNALRVAKGVVFAYLLLLLLVLDMAHDAHKTLRRLTLGMTLGVLGASLGVVWERLSSTGLFNFDSGYRVVGLFSGMHTGGAYVEGYLVTALPFVIWWEIQSKHWLNKLAAMVIFLLGCYALLVTYARGGYVAFMLSCLVLFSGLLARNWASFKKAHVRSAAIVALISFAWLIFAYQATPMHKRFNQLGYDKSLRVQHWEKIIGIMDQGWPVKLFGQGLGRLPAMYANRATGEQQSEYQFVTEQGKNYLQLTGGDPLYYEQVVDLQPSQTYQIEVVARNKTSASEMYLSICRKWMLYPSQCDWFRINLNPAASWQTYAFNVNLNRIKPAPWYVRPDIKLALENDQDNTTVDIASVSLKGADQRELVRNGDFAQGSRYWFFSTDNHLPWHFKNLLLQLYFEQGVFGLGLMLAALIYSFATLIRRRNEADYPAPLYAAALTGFLLVGVIDSLFDFPRMSMIFYLLLMLIQFRHPRLTDKAVN